MQIIPLQQAIETTGVKVLTYGFAGVGKTTLIATIPGKGLVLSAESGLLSLRQRIAAGTMAGAVDVVVVSTIDDVREAYAVLAKAGHGYDWVALDSVSEIAEVVLTSEKAKTKDPRQAYGALIDAMGSLLRAYRDLPLDVYFSAKAERVKDESTGKVTVQVLMPGAKLAQAIPYLFDEVFHLVVVEDKEGNSARWLQTARDARSDAKDRSGVLDAFEPADLGHVLRKIKGQF